MCVMWLELFYEAQTALAELHRLRRSTGWADKSPEREQRLAELRDRKDAAARRLLEHEERDGCRPSEREKKDLLLQWRQIQKELSVRATGR